MIEPFIPQQLRSQPFESAAEMDFYPIISKGLSSAGYDVSIIPEMRVRAFGPNVIDPKTDIPENWLQLELHHSKMGSWFELPAMTGGLTSTVEHFRIPPHLMGIVLGKSTYARQFVHILVTPAEPGWEGTLTVEIVNLNPRPVRIYANEGIGQMLFVPLSDLPKVSYADKKGKYQGQKGITHGRV